jgi:hypothetical protein
MVENRVCFRLKNFIVVSRLTAGLLKCDGNFNAKQEIWNKKALWLLVVFMDLR